LILAASAADKPAAPKNGSSGAAKAPAATAHKTSAAPRTASRQASSRSTGARRSTASGAARRPTTTWRNRQVAPTPDRYKEIQDALAAKGYLPPDNASGKWDQASVEALKKFQADQKLDSTGKLNSLSLIALGLGPKYEPPAPAKPADLPGESH
jgi:hypothetical protein